MGKFLKVLKPVITSQIFKKLLLSHIFILKAILQMIDDHIPPSSVLCVWGASSILTSFLSLCCFFEVLIIPCMPSRDSSTF